MPLNFLYVYVGIRAGDNLDRIFSFLENFLTASDKLSPKILSPNGKFIQFTYAIYKNLEDYYPDNFVLEKSFGLKSGLTPSA